MIDLGNNCIYVSTEGNDQWCGTAPELDEGQNKGPFRTVARARDAVRKKILSGMTGDITVIFREGTWT